MTFKTRHTFNVNATMPGDVGKLTRVLETWQPPALFMMNSLNGHDPNNIVVRFRNVMAQWGGKIIYRQYERQGGEAALWKHYTPDAYLDMLARFNAPWAWYNVGNEPVDKDPDQMRRMSDWYAEIATKAPGRGLCVILPGGFASGTYERDELRAFNGMWQAMGAQRHLKRDGWNVVMLGTHEYGHVDPRYHTDNDNIYDLMTPETARAHRFKTKADIFDGDPSDNWLILRTENILDIMAEACGVPRAQFEIDVAITECIWDRMPNIETGHRTLAERLDQMNGEKIYGWPKVKRVLEHLYGKPAAEVGADIWQWMEAVYPAYYRVFAHYSWTRHDDEPHYWYTRYGLEQADDLHEAWTKRLPSIGVPPVTTPPADIPIPTDKGAGIRATLNEDYKLRSGTGVGFAHLATLRAGTEVTYYPDTAKKDIAHATRLWVVVESAGNEPGWMASEDQFTPVVVFGEPTVQHPVPFQTQRNTGPNNCGEAALTSLLNYWLVATKRQGQVMIEDVINAVGNAGSYATLNQLKQASAELGLDLDIRTNLNMAFLRAELNANRPFVVLVDRADLPGAQSFYAFEGSHFVTVTGYGDGFITLHDPLSLPGGAGVHFKVADAAFLKAWETTPGNSGRFQALVAPPAEWEPVVPPVEEPPPPVVTPIDALRDRVFAAMDAWMEADAAAGAAIAEASLKASAFKSLYADYLALKQETLTLVEKDKAA